MNIQYIVIGIIALLLIGGGLYVGFGTPESVPVQTLKDKAHMMEDSSMMVDENIQDSGSYEVYAPEKLLKAKEGPVVLFFRASWCPTCRALDSDIRANLKAIPADTTLLDVDYDNSVELKKKYGVTYQHTFVQVDSEGTQITKWSGSRTLTDVLSHIKK